MKVGLIGFGRFGSFITKYLAQDSSLFVYDIKDKDEAIKQLGATPASLDTVCQCPIVIALTPISELEGLLVAIKDRIRKDALFIDGCSVKEYPLALMRSHLPDSVSLLGAHPMFGPDSARDTLMGTKIVLCPERVSDAWVEKLTAYLESHGIKTIVTAAAVHDEEIAHSLVLTHFVGRALIAIKSRRLDIDTKGHRRLIKILETVENDSWQLFTDMNRYNRFAPTIRKRFLRALEAIDKKLVP